MKSNHEFWIFLVGVLVSLVYIMLMNALRGGELLMGNRIRETYRFFKKIWRTKNNTK